MAAVVVFGAALVWILWPEKTDPARNSEWLEDVTYKQNPEQTRQWEERGEEGVRVLARALAEGASMPDRLFRDAHPKLPNAVRRMIPRQENPVGDRERAASLLANLDVDREWILPGFIESLKNDDADGVRMIVIAWFNRAMGDGEVSAEDKATILPLLIEAMGDNQSGVRNNAAISLQHFPEQAEKVIPVLEGALTDSYAPARLLAAQSLHILDPRAAIEADVVGVAIDVSKDPDKQVAVRGVRALGDFAAQPERALPVLIAHLRGPNNLLAGAAAWALGDFGTGAKTAVPALTGALEHKSRAVRHYAAMALEKITGKETTSAKGTN